MSLEYQKLNDKDVEEKDNDDDESEEESNVISQNNMPSTFFEVNEKSIFSCSIAFDIIFGIFLGVSVMHVFV
jgi:hypothetical protein